MHVMYAEINYSSHYIQFYLFFNDNIIVIVVICCAKGQQNKHYIYKKYNNYVPIYL